MRTLLRVFYSQSNDIWEWESRNVRTIQLFIAPIVASTGKTTNHKLFIGLIQHQNKAYLNGKTSSAFGNKSIDVVLWSVSNRMWMENALRVQYIWPALAPTIYYSILRLCPQHSTSHRKYFDDMVFKTALIIAQMKYSILLNRFVSIFIFPSTNF